MTPNRFDEIAARIASLRIVVLGDFCLDRYFEIDPTLEEISIETGLPVHQVINVRAQAGGAGTVLNNLCSLGVGALFPIGFCGEDGEGYELRRALERLPGVDLTGFCQTPARRTFTYGKPLVLTPGEPPRELSRLDSKNWTPTPEALQQILTESLTDLLPRADAILVMEQVDLPETGVVTTRLRDLLARTARQQPERWVLADSRTGLQTYPGLTLKMNLAELSTRLQRREPLQPSEAGSAAAELARQQNRPVIVTMAEHGILAATPAGEIVHAPAHPRRGPIDVVGAGDAVTASLGSALAAGATLGEAMEIAMAAASLVLHQLGTTGTATLAALRQLLKNGS